MPYDDDPTAGYQPGDVPSEPTEHIKVDIPVTPPSQNYNYQQSNTKQYTEQRYTNDDYGDENVMGEFIFSVVIIAVAFIVPYIFYYLKKLLKRLNFLSPRVLNMLNKLEPVFTRLAIKLSRKAIKTKLKTNLPTRANEATSIVRDTLSDSLREKLNVTPNGEPDETPPTVEGEEYVNTDEAMELPKADTESVKCLNPHAIIRKNLKG